MTMMKLAVNGMANVLMPLILLSYKSRRICDFDRFIRFYKKAFYLKKYLWYPLIRPRVGLLENLLTWIGPEKFSKFVCDRIYEGRHLPYSIPAFAHLGEQ
jgi:hypothetical protein